ncbi:MAG: phosphatase PAP2 family protein, partial [bacterium]
MAHSGKHAYAGYLLTAAIVLAAAVVIYPYDSAVYQTLRTFSHRVGKAHAVQELLNLFRCFGKGDVVLLIAAGLGLAGARRKSLHILLALLVMTLMIWPFKLAVARERPGFVNTHSFPSGDAATAAVFCVPLLTASPWTAPLAAVITGGVAVGRVYDGRHYPSDVLAGIAFGLLSGAAATAILRRWSFKPPRKWFLAGAVIMLAFAGINASWARALPFILNFLSIWGPLGCFLLILRFFPAWRRNKASRPAIPP